VEDSTAENNSIVEQRFKAMLGKLESALGRERSANNAKTKFLSNMSHEMRTPMNSIRGIAELQLQKNIHPPETEEAFARIYSSSNLLLSIINDILDLSKVEAGKMEMIPAPYETASMIVDTVQLNLMHVGSKEIEFKLSVDGNLPDYMIGDEIRIKQILNNILSNAFKYTEKGMVSLSFVAEEAPEKDSMTMFISVSDTGQGMTLSQLDSLFGDEFTRFNLKDNRAIEGSGLGLIIAYELTKMMGGAISAKSTPRKGSTFTVRLPQKRNGGNVLGSEMAEQLQDFKNSQKALTKISKIYREPMPYGRVLIVDDVESNLYVAKEFLVPYKIEADTAENGAQVISKIKDGEIYDIIFMDHMMPGLDGIETTKIIRGMGYSRPIVMLTANALSGSAQMFTENDFSGFISKPIDAAQLDKYLVRYIRDKQPPEIIESTKRAADCLTDTGTGERCEGVFLDMLGYNKEI